LVVDDEMLLRWSVAEALRSCGHTVIEASDAAAALRALAHDAIDAVLIDYWSSERDHFRLLKMVGALAPAAAVVLTTAFAIEGLEEHARALGAAALVHKPFNVFGIESVLWRVCQAGRADGREEARALPDYSR
jgi:DNA-binding NtrC family response regulator